MPMTAKIPLSDISLRSIDSNFKMLLYRDRFDLSKLIVNICTGAQTRHFGCNDPIKFISLLTWERQGLPESDCKIIFDHFKSVENLFNLSKEAREFSIKSLKITDKSKETIMKIFSKDEDYFID